MNPDLIFANSPYGKPGIDITKYIMENFPDANYAMLNTRSAFKKYYDKLACQFVQIGKYELGSNQKLDWGVEQAILLATNGRTEVVDNRKKDGKNKVGIENMSPCRKGFQARHTPHLVQVNKSGPYLGGAMDRHTASVTDTKPTDVKLRNGYLYVSFKTFEEACECAIDIVSWKNPSDSHYRCVKWGFVCGLIPHERLKNTTLDNIQDNITI